MRFSTKASVLFSVVKEATAQLCLKEFRDGSSVEQQLTSVKKVNKTMRMQ